MVRVAHLGPALPLATSDSIPKAARAYAVAGIPIFPCAPGLKRPLTEHGFHDATTELSQVEAWWGRTPDANIGIATGHGIDVLDIDVHATSNGFALLGELQRDGHIPGWAQAVRSPSGGIHLYFPSAPDREQRSWSRGSRHVDFRGIGGYIVAPPSEVMTDRGLRRYEVIAHGRNAAPIDADAIRALLTPPPAPASAPRGATLGEVNLDDLASWVARLPEGNRNAGLFWAACRLTEAGLTEAETRAVLEPAAIVAALEPGEIIATIRSAHRTTQLIPDSPDQLPDQWTSSTVGIGRSLS